MTALRVRSLLACLLASAFASPTNAQEDPLQGAVLLDRVMATVNDAVILNREVLALTLGQISVAERERGRPLSLPEKRGLLQRNLNSKIDQHALAQGAITLGIIPPERVESIFQDQLREEERELVRKLGTLQAVTEEQARQRFVGKHVLAYAAVGVRFKAALVPIPCRQRQYWYFFNSKK